MKIEKGTLVSVQHLTGGVFAGKLEKDVDTGEDQFFNVEITEGQRGYLSPGKAPDVPGDSTPCRTTMCVLTLA